MRQSNEVLLEMARDAYIAATNCLTEGDFETLGQLMAVRDELMKELASRFENRVVAPGCNEILAEVQVVEARFVEKLESTMNEVRNGLENRRRNQSKVRKYAR